MSVACIVFEGVRSEALGETVLYIDNRGSTSYLISDLSAAWSDLAPLDLNKRGELILKLASWYIENRTTVNIKIVDSIFEIDNLTNSVYLNCEVPDDQGRPTAYRVTPRRGNMYSVEWE